MEVILAELADMRAKLATQQETIARQEAAIFALQQEHAGQRQAPNEAPALHIVSAAHDEASEASDSSETPEQRTGLTSRRGLLRGAAAATAAAATVGAVTLGSTQTAHAAPAATGDTLITGQSNTETSATVLTNTNASIAAAALYVTTNANAYQVAAIQGVSQAGTMGVIGVDNQNGIGVYGYTNSLTGTGVKGDTLANGVGVWGEVRGEPGTGTAVFGEGFDSYGVVGSANNGWGVTGESVGSYDFVANGSGIVGVNVQAAVGAPTSGNFFIGDCIRDANGDLWLCTAGNGTSVGTWVKVAHLAPGATSGGAITYLSKPIRLFDSRSGSTDAASNPGVKCSTSAPTKVQVAGVTFNGVTVPASLAGAIGNVTVINESGGGYIALVPSGVGFSGTANIAFAAGQVVSNAFNVGLSSGGALDIIIGGNAVATDVIIDLFAVVA